MSTPHRWLDWAQRLQALAQTGRNFTGDPFDRQRYDTVHQIVAEMLAAGAELPPGGVPELIPPEYGYITPKVDVRAAVFRDERILLVLERADGRWTLPGGWADVGDRPSLAAEREVLEESGYEVRATKLAAVLDRRGHGHPPMVLHAWKLFFLCDLLGGEARTSIETDAVQFFGEDEIPDLSEGRVTRSQVALMFAHHRDRGSPTTFD